MERDLTNREWLAYWTKVVGEGSDAAERAANSAQWADELCKRVGATRRFVRRTAASMSSRAWQDVLARFEAIQDEWSAIEAVVHLELQLESEGRLIEEKQREPFRPVDKKHLTPTGPRFGR